MSTVPGWAREAIQSLWVHVHGLEQQVEALNLDRRAAGGATPLKLAELLPLASGSALSPEAAPFVPTGWDIRDDTAGLEKARGDAVAVLLSELGSRPDCTSAVGARSSLVHLTAEPYRAAEEEFWRQLGPTQVEAAAPGGDAAIMEGDATEFGEVIASEGYEMELEGEESEEEESEDDELCCERCGEDVVFPSCAWCHREWGAWCASCIPRSRKHRMFPHAVLGLVVPTFACVPTVASRWSLLFFDLMREAVYRDGRAMGEVVNADFQFVISDLDVKLCVSLKAGREGSVVLGDGAEHFGLSADATITIADADLGAMAFGKLRGRDAFMGGKLKFEGDMMLAQKLQNLLEIARATRNDFGFPIIATLARAR